MYILFVCLFVSGYMLLLGFKSDNETDSILTLVELISQGVNKQVSK
jgi:hypothetical protein